MFGNILLKATLIKKKMYKCSSLKFLEVPSYKQKHITKLTAV